MYSGMRLANADITHGGAGAATLENTIHRTVLFGIESKERIE